MLQRHMETVKVQLIEKDAEEIAEAVCIHSGSRKAPSLSNSRLRRQTQLTHATSRVPPERDGEAAGLTATVCSWQKL